MTQFHIPTWLPAKALHANKREENHGQQIVDCMDMKWRIEVPNRMLDEWFPGLRQALYVVSDTQPIPGVEDTTPNLRTQLIEGPYKVKGDWPGYIFHARRGNGNSPKSQVELGGTEVGVIAVDAKQGGTCIVDFRTKNAGLDEERMGRMNGMAGRDVEIMAIPPKLQDGTLPDGHKVPTKPGKVKAVSSKQISLVPAGDERPEPPAEEGKSPFKYSVDKDGNLKDNSPAKSQDSAHVTPPAEKPDETPPSATDIWAGQGPAPSPKPDPFLEGITHRAPAPKPMVPAGRVAKKPAGKKKIAGRGPK